MLKVSLHVTVGSNTFNRTCPVFLLIEKRLLVRNCVDYLEGNYQLVIWRLTVKTENMKYQIRVLRIYKMFDWLFFISKPIGNRRMRNVEY
jgi:hypothetical protein